jgi:hypothetical protein
MIVAHSLTWYQSCRLALARCNSMLDPRRRRRLFRPPPSSLFFLFRFCTGLSCVSCFWGKFCPIWSLNRAPRRPCAGRCSVRAGRRPPPRLALGASRCGRQPLPRLRLALDLAAVAQLRQPQPGPDPAVSGQVPAKSAACLAAGLRPVLTGSR